ncbi:MAG: HEPN domain-containing protein [Anaerolineales bacterium]|nr:HEPN domain-containing protein [Anaerolineales bacterium]
MEKANIVKHWTEGSDRDFQTMEHLFQSEDYHWALFIGHLVLEKLLKAFYAENVTTPPPLTHNLLLLAEKGNLELNETQKDILVTITAFNIQARYDDYKLAFYKTCTKEYTQKWVSEIGSMRQWIKAQLLQS